MVPVLTIQRGHNALHRANVREMEADSGLGAWQQQRTRKLRITSDLPKTDSSLRKTGQQPKIQHKSC